MRRLPFIGLVCVVFAASTAVSYQQRVESSGQKMVAASEKFLASLDEGQRAKALLPYEAKERIEWHFVPLETRKGLPLKEMSQTQHDLARELAMTALSASGYKKVETIIQLENLLQALEGPGRRWPRDWQLYYVTFYGSPSQESRWGLSIEGHHLSLNFVVEKGKVIASTPQFLGSNPATVKTGGAGVEAGTRVLAGEEQTAFDLLASLDENTRKTAWVSKEAPREIRAADQTHPPQEKAVGVEAGDLSESQQATLRKLIDAYASTMPEAVAKARLAAIEEAGFEKTKFAWFGADKPGIGHGYRVQGPTFVIEFVNTQPDAEGNPANHIHCVWRDMRGDFALPIR